MMFVVMMLIDIFTATVIMLAHVGLASKVMIFYHATYLIAKGGWYWRAWVSWIDIFIGLYMFVMILGPMNLFISSLAAVYLCSKIVTYLIMKN